MSKYSRLQVMKHALEYYIQRPEATLGDVKRETLILNDITHQISQIKTDYNIKTSTYRVTHVMGDVWEFACSSEKSAKSRAFRHYKKEYPFAKYAEFINNTKVKKIN